MKRKKICIDAGHGNQDPGALGPKGLKESMTALSVAMLLGGMLAPYVDVAYTRKTDEFLSLSDRAKKANAEKADLFLSIHCNSGEPGKGEGFEVFTTPGQTGSDPFATALFLAYAEAFPEKRKRLDDKDGDPDKEASFAVLRLTDMPAALFELEFIHTEAGEAFLKDPMNHARMAKALCQGVLNHLGITIPSANPGVSAPATSGEKEFDPPLEVQLRDLLQNIVKVQGEMIRETRESMADLGKRMAAQNDEVLAFEAKIKALKGGAGA